MKFITAIVAFSIAFGFSAFLTDLFGANNQLHFQSAENNQTGQEISAFLQQDIENGQEMDAVCETSASYYEYSEAVGEYAADSAALANGEAEPHNIREKFTGKAEPFRTSPGKARKF